MFRIFGTALTVKEAAPDEVSDVDEKEPIELVKSAKDTSESKPVDEIRDISHYPATCSDLHEEPEDNAGITPSVEVDFDPSSKEESPHSP